MSNLTPDAGIFLDDLFDFAEEYAKTRSATRACLIHPYYDICGLKNGIRLLTEAVRVQYGNLEKAEWISDDYMLSMGYYLLSVVYTV